MAMTVLKGQASRVTVGTDVSGSTGTSTQLGTITTSHTVSLLISKTPAHFSSRNVLMIKDGDEVTAAGELRNGVFRAEALRNDATGVAYFKLAAFQINLIMFVVVPLCVLLGLLFLPLGGLGILPLGAAYFTYRLAARTEQAAKLLGA